MLVEGIGQPLIITQVIIILRRNAENASWWCRERKDGHLDETAGGQPMIERAEIVRLGGLVVIFRQFDRRKAGDHLFWCWGRKPQAVAEEGSPSRRTFEI